MGSQSPKGSSWEHVVGETRSHKLELFTNFIIMDEGLQTKLTRILKPKFHTLIKHWFITATKREKKGISLINKIFVTNGKQIFRQKTQDLDTRQLDAADVEIRRRYMQSKYTAEYGSNIFQKTSESAVLNFKKLHELPCAAVIQENVIRKLQKWIDRNPCEDTRDIVLASLRSLYSVIKVQTHVPSSTQRGDFIWSSQGNLKIAQKPKPAISPAKTQSEKRIRTSLPSIRQFDMNLGLLGAARKAKDKFMRGNGAITSWLSHLNNPTSSTYQANYVNPIQTTRLPTQNDFSTSMVGSMSPDPNTMRQTMRTPHLRRVASVGQ